MIRAMKKPAPPKFNKSIYFLYYQDVFEEVKKTNSTSTLQEINNVISSQFKQLNTDEIQELNKRFDIDKHVFDIEKKHYEDKHGEIKPKNKRKSKTINQDEPFQAPIIDTPVQIIQNNNQFAQTQKIDPVQPILYKPFQAPIIDTPVQPISNNNQFAQTQKIDPVQPILIYNQQTQQTQKIGTPIQPIQNNNQQAQQTLYLRFPIQPINNKNQQAQQTQKIDFTVYPSSNNNRQTVDQQPQFQFFFKEEDKDVKYLEQNSQINQYYQIYMKDNSKNYFPLYFSLFKEPGTHRFDLVQNTVINKSRNTTHKINFDDSGYFIEGERLQDRVSIILDDKKTEKKYKFDLYLQIDRIIFFSEKEAQQQNTETNFRRDIFKTIFVPPSAPAIILPSELQDAPFSGQLLPLQNDQFALPWNNQFEPNLQNQDPLPSDDQIDTQFTLSFPPFWTLQQENFLRVRLDVNSWENCEQKKIEKLFYKSSTQQIFQINRIQNYFLHRRYRQDQNGLIERYQQGDIRLSKSEKEQYLFHGVKNDHPEIIYNNQGEGFCSSYSQGGNWGKGTYFSTRAAYSERYCHTLLDQVGPQSQAMKVMLVCKVMIGRSKYLSQDKSILRAPENYDSVTGDSNGTQIYVLYNGEVRRAYPAYEIIFYQK